MNTNTSMNSTTMNMASMTTAAATPAAAALAADTLSGFGGALTSLLRTPCLCTGEAQRAGGFIGARRQSTSTALAQAHAAIATAKRIDWTGNAASRCRDALDACARSMTGLDDRLRETTRLTHTGGAS
ncbi:hypothetical protein [Bifidobacterium leontopitheci]|nr:hypothetical protein [Bifidobacterium leontopitheci]